MTTDPKTAESAPPKQGIRRIDLRTILGPDREVIICHRDKDYHLRLTSNDKLLLTK